MGLKMNEKEEIIESFLKNPTESLKIEIKEWLDITSDHGKAKLVKSCIALYNNNGGLLVIGFDNNGTIKSQFSNEKIKEDFHFDAIQQIISRYSSELIEVSIILHNFKNKLYPFIFIPSGVKRPSYIKSELISKDINGNQKILLGNRKIFIRTLSSNGTVSSSEPQQKDWDKLFDYCMENREGDIAKFLQKHLTETHLKTIGDYFTEKNINFSKSEKPNQNPSINCLSYGYKCFLNTTKNNPLVNHGSFQVAFKINDSNLNIKLSQTLLNLLKVNNPRPSGWPLWVILLNSPDELKKPKKYENRYEGLILDRFNIDFWVITKEKCFYHYRAFRDDINGSETSQAKNAKLKTIDYVWQTQLISESIKTALSFSKSLGAKEDTNLSFTFKLTGLKNRLITSWAHPAFEIYNDEKSNEDIFSYSLDIPINTSEINISFYTFEIIQSLFLMFGGFEYTDNETINNIVNDHLKIG